MKIYFLKRSRRFFALRASLAPTSTERFLQHNRKTWPAQKSSRKTKFFQFEVLSAWNDVESKKWMSVILTSISNLRGGVRSLDMLHCLSTTEGLKKAAGLSGIFLLGPCCGRLRSVLQRWGRRGEEDDEEPKTINHGWCHLPQSLWPAPLWSHRCDSPKHINTQSTTNQCLVVGSSGLLESFMFWNL